MMISTGKLIWISCRPLIRLIVCVSSGFAIAKADIFTPLAASGAGQIVVNITIPCLLFSKIVPAFTSDNINALGPLVLVAILYQLLGFALALIIKQLFWVPHRFRYGILVAAGWNNDGDIPTAVVMSITGAAPFGGVHDQNLAVAYISVFMLVSTITFFPCGGHKLVAWDFQGPDVEHEEVREAIRQRWRALLQPLSSLRMRNNKIDEANDDLTVEIVEILPEKEDFIRNHAPYLREKHCSFVDDSSTVLPAEGTTPELRSPLSSTDVTYHNLEPSSSLGRNVMASGVEFTKAVMQASGHTSTPTILPTQATPDPPVSVTRVAKQYLAKTRGLLKTLFTPASITILTSLPIATVPQLKALFVQVPGISMGSASDELPPLSFVLDIATFVGAASVPLGLICLGSCLARLNVPRKGEWRALPLGAISGIAIAKMVIKPVLGVVICEGLTNAGVIPRDDNVLRFVCIFFACLPTATIHVILTQVYSGTGSAEHLSPFLILQYCLMVISMPVLIAYFLLVQSY